MDSEEVLRNDNTTEDTLVVSEQCLAVRNQLPIHQAQHRRRTISVAQATVIQKVSHPPLRPKYGFLGPSLLKKPILTSSSEYLSGMF